MDCCYLAISSQEVCPEPIPDRIRRLLDLGVPYIQLRDKTESIRVRHRWTVQLAPAYRDRLLINGRPDLALLTGSAGVHLPARSYSISDARTLVDDTALIGRSTHRREEAMMAEDMGADYITFGPVYPTPSKPDWEKADLPGLDGLKEVCKTVSIPVLALGGIDRPNRIRASLEAGASGVAGIRMLFASDSPKRDWKQARTAIDSVRKRKEHSG